MPCRRISRPTFDLSIVSLSGVHTTSAIGAQPRRTTEPRGLGSRDDGTNLVAANFPGTLEGRHGTAAPLRFERSEGRRGRSPVKARVLEVVLAPHNRKWWTLLSVSFGLFMIMLDNTVVNVALPSMQRALHISTSELERVVVGYALSFATFMLTGGKLADLFGRRRLFVVGLTIFTGASLAC